MSEQQANSRAAVSPGLSARENTDGVIAAYIHEISERHRPSAPAAEPVSDRAPAALWTNRVWALPCAAC
jgi:hypothetical protein